MKEFKTANDNMGDFTYMPGFSAVAAAMMNETAAKAADGSAKVADVFADRTDHLGGYAEELRPVCLRVTSLGLVNGPA